MGRLCWLLGSPLGQERSKSRQIHRPLRPCPLACELSPEMLRRMTTLDHQNGPLKNETPDTVGPVLILLSVNGSQTAYSGLARVTVGLR